MTIDDSGDSILFGSGVPLTRVEAANGDGTTLDEFPARPDPQGTAAVQRLSDDAQLTVGGAALAGVSYTYYPAQAWGELFLGGLCEWRGARVDAGGEK